MTAIDRMNLETCIIAECTSPVTYHCSGMLCDAPLCEVHADYDHANPPHYYCPECWEQWKKQMQDGNVGEAGAVFAFMGWLTCRDAVSGPFSRKHDASEAARLAGKFCEMQGWQITDEDWHRHIKPYERTE